MGLVLWGDESEERMFFFKKKNQKIFVLRVVATVLPGPAGAKVFLVLFLQKKNVLSSRFKSG
jgi:hypothetical protein